MKKYLSGIFIFFLVVIFSISCQSQNAEFTGWFTTFNTLHLYKNFGLQTDAQFRTNDQWKGMQLLMVRVGGTYRFNKNTVLGIGYIHSNERETINDTSGFALEQRIYEELLITQKIKPFNLLHRIRFEERFLPVTELVNNKIETLAHKYTTRFCYLLRGVIPFSHEKSFTHGNYVSMQDEVFLTLTNKDHVNGSVFDLNRGGAGFGHRFNEGLDAEIGYLGQLQLKSSGKYSYTHILACTLIYRMNKHAATGFNPVPVVGGQ